MELRRHGRGYLPHVEGKGLTQFVTWRLADAIPLELIREWELERDASPSPKARQEFYRKVEQQLDAGLGSQLLKNPLAAGIVQEALFYYHGSRFSLHAWTVMPTHVHVVFTLLDQATLSKTIKDLKGYTARQINGALKQTGQLWQADYFDRFIRDGEHFDRVTAYVEWNAVKAGLCTDPKLWTYSSSCPSTMDRLLSRERDSEVPNPGCGLGGPRSFTVP